MPTLAFASQAALPGRSVCDGSSTLDRRSRSAPFRSLQHSDLVRLRAGRGGSRADGCGGANCSASNQCLSTRCGRGGPPRPLVAHSPATKLMPSSEVAPDAELPNTCTPPLWLIVRSPTLSDWVTTNTVNV